ncbi:MAG TPA: ATP-binding protein, partial [Candidatus Paceibacterota bacterium]|nr:ATP-binding protein [Candidatus Paceibacterota bacterium]
MRDLKLNPTEDLERGLFETCLDGEFSPQCDPDWQLAAAYRDWWIQKHSGDVENTVGRKILEAFANARETRSLVLIQGVSGIGKSHIARGYVQRSAGLARLINVPSSGDDQSFFRTIATALGLSSSLKLKAVEMRERIEATLCGGDLELIFDQAEFLFPQFLRGYSLPSRLAWIRTALVDRGVPVSILATPQYEKEKFRTEKLTGWNSSQ